MERGCQVHEKQSIDHDGADATHAAEETGS